MDELSSEELAVRSGVTAEQLRRLVELGIITPTPQDAFRPSDIQRIRVVDTLAAAGFAPEQLSELIATGAYNLDWASMVFPRANRSTDHHPGADGGRHQAAAGPGGTPLRRLGAAQASAGPGAPSRRRRAPPPGRTGAGGLRA